MNYLLETSTCSLLMAHNPRVVAHFDSLSNEEDYVFICTIVRGEILFGIEQMPIGRRRQTVENQAINLFARMPCFAVPESAGDAYAKIKRAAQRQGTPLGENDLWIAATALALDAVLVTSDSDFQRIVGLGLQLEDWAK